MFFFKILLFTLNQNQNVGKMLEKYFSKLCYVNTLIHLISCNSKL